MEATFPLVFAAMMGFTHAFEADHLLAVSNIVTRRNSVWMAIKDGIAWGLGHTSTIFLIGILIIVGKVAITEQTFHYFEATVGAMLVALGLLRMRFLWKNGGSQDGHVHFQDLFFRKKRSKSQAAQAPFRSQKISTSAAAGKLQFAPQPENHKLAYAIGLVHGLAGSGALVLLVMSQISGPAGAMGYLLVFGLGSIGGMLLASGVFSLPFSRKITTNATLQLGLTLLSSLLCVGYGMQVIVENITS